MPPRRLLPLAAALVASVALTALAACSIHQRMRSAAGALTTPDDRSVCVLFFDGLSAEAFQHFLAAGAVPNLRKEIVEKGLVFETAVASVPSETYPNLGALLTGLYPGHHGIPANIWLDRRLRLAETHTNIFRILSASDFLAPDARTLYERLPADSVAVTSPIARGATVDVKNVLALTASYARWDWEFLDRKTLDDIGDAYMGALDTGRLPSLAWAHLLGTDEVAHADGPESPEFRSALENIDRSFARLVRRLRRRGAYEKILFVIVGDHGNRSYGIDVDAEELVHRALFAHPTEADCAIGNCVLVPVKGKKAKSYDVGDALIAVGAYRGAMIWLPSSRPPEDVPRAFALRKKKTSKPSPKKKPAAKGPPAPMPPLSDFAATLARAPEVALVITRGTGGGAHPRLRPRRRRGDRPRGAGRRRAALRLPRHAGDRPARIRDVRGPRALRRGGRTPVGRMAGGDGADRIPGPRRPAPRVLRLPAGSGRLPLSEERLRVPRRKGRRTRRALAQRDGRSVRLRRSRRRPGTPPFRPNGGSRSDDSRLARHPVRPRLDGRRRPGDRNAPRAAADVSDAPLGILRIRTVFVAPSARAAPETSTTVRPERTAIRERNRFPARSIASTERARGIRKETTSERSVIRRRTRSSGVKATIGIPRPSFETRRVVRPDSV